ncbi:MAG: type I-G CRISPR-associated protein Cas8g1/Csx17 [Cyanobium sp.]
MKTSFTTSPLSSYLAAIGLLRIVGEQLDPGARGFWRSGRFHLETDASLERIAEFLSREYKPSPCITPWNKDSGFPVGTPAKEFRALKGPRFEEISRIVDSAAALIPRFTTANSNEDKVKARLLEALDRAGDSDAWSAWLGTCAVTFHNQKGELAVRFPALLGGTGGAFGRADFGLKFVKALQVVQPEHFIAAILGSDQRDLMIKAGDSLIYDPASRCDSQQGYGIATQDTQQSRDGKANPATLILLAEGITLFEGYAMTTAPDGDASDGSQHAAFTLAVAHNSSGHPSSSWLENDGNQSEELWCPLWDEPCHYSDVRDALRRIALLPLPRQLRTGTDLALFASCLGRRLNLSGFARYCFPARIGQGTKIPSLIEVFPLDEARADRTDALADVVKLASRLRRHAKNKTIPSSYRHAAERVVAQVEAVAGGGGSYAELLRRLLAWRRQEELSQKERKPNEKTAMSLWLSFQFGSRSLPPQWFSLLERELDGPEWRLALALGTGQRLPTHLLRATRTPGSKPNDKTTITPLATGRPYAGLADVLLLLEGRVDAELVDDLTLAVAWIERRGLPRLPPPDTHLPWLPPDYLAGLLLNQWHFEAHSPVEGDRARWRELLLAGRPVEAMEVALHRLRVAEVVSWAWPAMAASDPHRLLRAVEVPVHPRTLGRAKAGG